MAADLSIVKLRFFGMAIGDILRAIRGHSLMGAFTLSVCAIDAMAYLRNARRRRNNRENFECWVNAWMVPLNGRCRPDVLYALRCGLVHTYGYADAMQRCQVEGFSYVHDRPGEHWSQPIAGSYILNLDSHIAEVAIAGFRFFDDLSSNCARDESLATAVETRVNKLLSVQRYQEFPLHPGRRKAIVRSSPMPRRYGEIHPALAHLDEVAEPEVAPVQAGIRTIYSQH